MSGGLAVQCGRVVGARHLVQAMHLALAALRADAVVDALVRQEGVPIGDVGLLRLIESEQRATGGELFLTLAVGEEAVIANASKLRGRDVGEEAPDEFLGAQAHDLLDLLSVLPFFPVVEVGEGNDAVVDAEDAVVGNGDAVDVAPQIPDQVVRLGEGLFGIHDPGVGAKPSEQPLPAQVRGERGLAGQVQLAVGLGRLQRVDEFLAEDSG